MIDWLPSLITAAIFGAAVAIGFVHFTKREK